MLSHCLICITLIIMKMNVFVWAFKLLIILSFVNYLITSFAFNCANSIFYINMYEPFVEDNRYYNICEFASHCLLDGF